MMIFMSWLTIIILTMTAVGCLALAFMFSQYLFLLRRQAEGSRLKTCQGLDHLPLLLLDCPRHEGSSHVEEEQLQQVQR
jgi:hypothetical protein